MAAKASCTTTAHIPPPTTPLIRRQTDSTLDATQQFHRKSISADASSSLSHSQNPESTVPGKTRRGRSTSNIPIHSPRSRLKDPLNSRPFATFLPSLNTKNTNSQNEPTNASSLRSPTSEDSTATSQSLSPHKSQRNQIGSESRSKKPPASHSSYGIETSTGPPPSFATQRTRSQDRMWKPPTPDSSDVSPTLKQAFTSGDMTASQGHGDGVSPNRNTATDREEFETSDATEMSGQSTVRIEDESLLNGERSSTEPSSSNGQANGIDSAAGQDNSPPSSGEDQQSGKSEDIFLKIAKSESSRPKASPSSQTRSRLALPSAYVPPAYSEQSNDNFSISPRTNNFPSPDAFPSARTDTSRNTSKRSSLTYRPSTASAHPHENVTRNRYFNSPKSTTSSTIGRDISDGTSGIPQVSGRRFSNADRSYRPSQTTSLRNTHLSTGVEPERQRFEGTESTVSTAVSNCFDDLHEIKSRLNRLEQSSKTPPATVTSNERPRTATTTITTMSSSPKHRMRKNESPVQTSIGGVPSTVHPLLHEALAKAKPVISAEIYQRLEATAADALQLASLLGGGSSGASIVGHTSSVERQLRRRGDSMCRGLTELAITLSSQSAHQSPQVLRPASRDVNSPEDTQSTIARVQSRIESRRRSLLAGATATVPESPRLASPETAVNNLQPRPPSSRLNRTSLLKYRREDGHLDDTEEEDPRPSIRPASRAMTELGGPGFASRSSPRDRTFSREYTSQHPLPSRERQDSSPSYASNIPSRRSYASPAAAASDVNNSSPLTPSFQARSGLRRYGGSIDRASTFDTSMESTPDSGGSRLSKPSQRRSLGLGSQLSGLGSSVRSRLRAAKAERGPAVQTQQEAAEDRGITALPVASHRAVHAR
ncbi:MAG: hypothetical protein Q9160_006346 [Pyrenula sp. 1 TL-2023]